MLSIGAKKDVLANVSAELVMMFGVLTTHYTRPQFEAGLPELEKIETYLKAKQVEYDPEYVKFFAAENI